MPAITTEQLAGASREELVVMVVALSEQVLALSEQVRVLSAQVDAAKTTSRTSSKPPSSDGYAKPAPTSRRKRSGRRPGGQPGAPGATLRQVADPDVVLVHGPGACAGCGSSLADAPVLIVAVRQVADLPLLRLTWTEHRVQSRRCGCGHVSAAGGADGVPAVAVGPAQYGRGVKAVATGLVDRHFLPFARAAQVMGDLLGAPVSPGSVATWHAAAGATLQCTDGFCDQVAAALRAQSVVHADETGLRVAGALAWVHIAATTTSSLFTVHVGAGRRGRAAIVPRTREVPPAAGVLGGLDPGAVLVSVPREREVPPAWAPYLTYDTLHALCCAHLVRELRAVAEAAPACTTEAGSQSWAGKLLVWFEALNTDVHIARDAGATALDPVLLARRMATFEHILVLAHEQNPAPPGGWPAAPRRPKAVNLLARIEDRRKDYLRFTSDFAVPFTNNAAERDLRGVRLREKVSGCLRTLPGAEAFVAIRWGHLPLMGVHRGGGGRVWCPSRWLVSTSSRGPDGRGLPQERAPAGG